MEWNGLLLSRLEDGGSEDGLETLREILEGREGVLGSEELDEGLERGLLCRVEAALLRALAVRHAVLDSLLPVEVVESLGLWVAEDVVSLGDEREDGDGLLVGAPVGMMLERELPVRLLDVSRCRRSLEREYLVVVQPHGGFGLLCPLVTPLQFNSRGQRSRSVGLRRPLARSVGCLRSLPPAYFLSGQALCKVKATVY